MFVIQLTATIMRINGMVIAIVRRDMFTLVRSEFRTDWRSTKMPNGEKNSGIISQKTKQA
jgi:hypothetical protein